jgi:hypothetical protein
VDEEVRAALLERYKTLCVTADELRQQGEQEMVDKLVEGEMKMLLDILLGRDEKAGDTMR